MTNSNLDNSGQTIIINQENKSNGVGTTGFVLALIALFLGWVPVLGWITWLLGLILSFVGVFRSPKGLSIAGLIISLFLEQLQQLVQLLPPKRQCLCNSYSENFIEISNSS